MQPTNPAADQAVAALIDLGVSRGAARGIVRDYPTLAALASATPQRLERHGVRPLAARRIAAAFRLVRLADATPMGSARDGARHVRTPAHVEAVARARWGHEAAEHFAVAYLDARQAVIDLRVVGQGSLAQVDVHPREVFAPAMEPPKAHAVILIHNHPSGDPSPSDADVALTHRLSEVGRLVGIPVLDHMIVCRNGCCSMAQLGLVGAP